MANKVLYVGKADAPWWERAEKRAAQKGMALSKYVARLLRADDMDRQTGVIRERTIEELRAEVEELLDEIWSRLDTQPASEEVQP